MWGRKLLQWQTESCALLDVESFFEFGLKIKVDSGSEEWDFDAFSVEELVALQNMVDRKIGIPGDVDIKTYAIRLMNGWSGEDSDENSSSDEEYEYESASEERLEYYEHDSRPRKRRKIR